MKNYYHTKKVIILGVWGLLVIAFLAVIIQRIASDAPVIDNSVGVWFLEDDPELIDYKRFNRDFAENEWTILLLRTESIYAKEFLRELDQVVRRLEQQPHIRKVISIVNVRDNEMDAEDALDYKVIYPGHKNNESLLSRKQLEHFKNLLWDNPIFEDNIIQRGNQQFTTVLIQNDNFIDDPSPYRIELVDAIETIVSSAATIQSHALAGTTVVNAELNRAAKRDVLVFYSLISLLLIIVGWFALGNIKDVLVMLSAVVCSVIPIMGLLALLEIPYNMVTVMMPTILISLSVAGVIHIINEFHRRRLTEKSSRAINQAVSHLWKPNLFTALTTIVGFSSLAFSTVYPIFQLGVFASLGIFLSCLATITVAPVLLLMLWSEGQVKAVKRNALLYRCVCYVRTSSRRAPTIKWLLLLLMLLPASGIYYLQTDTNYTKFFSDSLQISQAYQAIDAAGYGQNPINIVLQYPAERTFSDEPYFQQLMEFEQQLEQLPEVIKLLSAGKLIKQIDRTFNAETTSDAQFKTYGAAAINQLYLLGELSNNDDIDDFLLQDKSQTQIVALTPYLSTKQLMQFKVAVQRLKDKYLPVDVKLNINGTTVLWANMDTQVSRTQLISLLGVSTFLLFFLALIFKSLRIALLGLLVNALPLAITLGVMGWLNIKINMATAIIGGIALGIVVDDTIHFITRYLHGLAAGLTTQEAIEETLMSVGESIIVTSVILVGGFSCMASSNFLPSAHFGIFISLAIALALLLDLFLLPVLLRLCYPQKCVSLVKPVSESVTYLGRS